MKKKKITWYQKLQGKEYCLYWIHSDEMVDIFSEGYVGITKNANARIKSHTHQKYIHNEQKLYHAWRHPERHGKFKFEVIKWMMTLKEANRLELKYRPEPGIGLNNKRGGDHRSNEE